jgi:hypothetical protein
VTTTFVLIGQRFPSIGSTPAADEPLAIEDATRLRAALTHLGKLKAAKPRTRRTLLSTLHSLFRKELSEEQLALLLEALCVRGVVRIDGAKVSYDLGSGP